MRSIALGKDRAATPRISLNGKPLLPVRSSSTRASGPTASTRRRPTRRSRSTSSMTQRARLQPRAQARQGRARSLVLLVRSARPAGLAGHAERRQRHRADRCRHPAQRRVGARAASASSPASWTRSGTIRRSLCGCRLQRGLGPVRHGAIIAAGCKPRSDAASSTSAAGWTDRERRRRARRAHATRPGNAAARGATRRACSASSAASVCPLAGHTWQEEANWGYRTLHRRARSSPTRTASSWTSSPLPRAATASARRSTRRRPTSRSRSTVS